MLALEHIIEHFRLFFNMGGYAFYVWSAFGAAFCTMVANYFIPKIQRRRLLNNLKRTNESIT